LVLSNGRLMVAIDRFYAVRDFFSHQIGTPNHLNGHSIRLGVWVEGQFAWLDQPGWERKLGTKKWALAGDSTLFHSGLQLSLHIEEGIHPVEPWWLRKIAIRDRSGRSREVRLFQTHDLRINESDVSDTALFHPELDSIIHFKANEWIGFGGEGPDGKGMSQYACGIKAFNGFEGTWRDAEDGTLSNKPIEQGTVDSTLGFTLVTNPDQPVTVWLTCITADSLKSLTQLDQKLCARGVSSAFSDMVDWPSFWYRRQQAEATGLSASVEEGGIEGDRQALQLLREPPAQAAGFEPETLAAVSDLGVKLHDLFARSLLILRAHVNVPHHSSARSVVAAVDSDIMATNRANYGCVWPRDGVLTAWTLAATGDRTVGLGFASFMAEVQKKSPGLRFQKYRPDAYPAATWHPWITPDGPEQPFQQDQVALVGSLSSLLLSDHFTLDSLAIGENALNFRRRLVDEVFLPVFHLLVDYRHHSGLPLPSYDLWEERRGVHFWTTCCTVWGLRSLASLFASLGLIDEAEKAQEVANQMESAAYELFTDPYTGRLCRTIHPQKDGTWQRDTVPDSSVLAGLLVKGVKPGRERISQTVKWVESDLVVKSRITGVARYDHDYYFRKSDSFPGNPWVISTLWLAQAYITLGKKEEALHWLHWATERAEATGVLAEQFHPETGEPLSVSPLAWSHGEFIDTVLHFLEAFPTGPVLDDEQTNTMTGSR
jgi:GH15 family glucan-1,4-alpha-glucosidase